MKFFVYCICLSYSMIYAAPKYGCVDDTRPIGNYITGDAYREIADFCFEEKYHEYWAKPTPQSFFKKQKEAILKDIKAGDIIFIREHLLQRFFEQIHPKIPAPYILISAKHDDQVGERYRRYLDDPKLIRWFAININMEHPKLTIVPIGIIDRFWLKTRCEDEFLFHKMEQDSGIKRSYKMYLNVVTWTNINERSFVCNTFKNREDVTFCPGNRSMQEYLYDLKSHVFCLSPSGNGIQCWRTWESMIMGCIPIIRPVIKIDGGLDKVSHSDCISAIGHDCLYKDLPVIIVKEWNEVTPEFLKEKYEEISQKEYNLEKMYFAYWKNLIEGTARKFKEGK